MENINSSDFKLADVVNEIQNLEMNDTHPCPGESCTDLAHQKVVMSASLARMLLNFYQANRPSSPPNVSGDVARLALSNLQSLFEDLSPDPASRKKSGNLMEILKSAIADFPR